MYVVGAIVCRQRVFILSVHCPFGLSLISGLLSQDARELQGDLDRLYDWVRKWQMEFNIGKCSTLSVGRNNPLHNYS